MYSYVLQAFRTKKYVESLGMRLFLRAYGENNKNRDAHMYHWFVKLITVVSLHFLCTQPRVIPGETK